MNCGLLTSKKEPVPLKSISVEVSVNGFIADVSSTFTYENTESNPVEAVFVFPMEDGSSVYDFHAEIGGNLIEATIKEKQEAIYDYDDAISSGQEAFLLEESDESPDVFRLSVGSLPAGQTASVSLSYVTELPVQADDALRFFLPTVLCPRYTPQGTTSLTSEVPFVPCDSVPYSLSLNCHLSSLNGIASVKSNSSLSPLEYLSDDKTEAKVSLSPGFQFDRDVELLIYYSQAHQPTAVVEAGVSTAAEGSLMGVPLVMVSLYPEFSRSTEESLTKNGEFIFLMDCSGSMKETMEWESNSARRIESARDTLLLLLKSLPFGCYFNICLFGSHFKFFFPKSVEYTQQTMESAMKKVKDMDANLGGTEILSPLCEIFREPCKPGYPRQLFVFTDGEVGNIKEVIEKVKKNSAKHRCFTFGIGDGASTALIKGMAKAGNGHFQFVCGKDRMQAKVMQTLSFALQPAVTNVALNWHVPDGMEVVPVSETPMMLFSGQQLILYSQLKGKVDETAVGHVSLQYSLCDMEHKTEMHFALNCAKHSRLTAHRLAAKSLINQMEEKKEEQLLTGGGIENLKKNIVEMSSEARVLSPYTAFIAINKESREAIQAPLIRRDIPCGDYMNEVSLFNSGDYMNEVSLFNSGDYMNEVSSFDSEEYYMNELLLFNSAMPCDSSLKASLPKKKGSSLISKIFMKCLSPASNSMSELPVPVEEEKQKDPMLKLISFQKANGSWELQQELINLFNKAEQEVLQKKPKEISDKSVWATFLALLWLHGFNSHMKDEWKFVALKAVSWIKAQPGLNLSICLQAGNDLLGCQLDLKTLEL
ncbi:von Willebrand factor A domain-containing protein 5A-like isoform X12 [Erpetoichthys calabaricus]|uniref:von Willebrand factor A domain-containing protein 5A-like isoform X8 n=1 Tax=Erpetoichthys calabaricus TaxID=27687 RepID=UPI002234B332|nr:von Willebrand factor A domain-containing protein 5A-like isoform X8 [Erpetoichthys calabaricus]XP_051779070.1 von Willebrand factor A domain-containing protein 5A-like isoform X9 [Erpetoichthys calabaricus]XP_051779071.1 von Willebrand factor A domain-containing protein 5A-like isoform X10 [Erpetoichthys calabaricus]XP_051779072.1 von Willebrand factor A domain-containing protein 5A-like isoform X11 [Erpetoichthys calabaricus]XP_051779073.1 von Willebrand factor A domain-containing protein 